MRDAARRFSGRDLGNRIHHIHESLVAARKGKVMPIHRFEKIWLTFGLFMLFVFLGILGVSAFVMGVQPPSVHQARM
jgi:hypothetical protein